MPIRACIRKSRPSAAQNLGRGLPLREFLLGLRELHDVGRPPAGLRRGRGRLRLASKCQLKPCIAVLIDQTGKYARLYAAAVARRQADQIYNLSLTRTDTNPTAQ